MRPARHRRLRLGIFTLGLLVMPHPAAAQNATSSDPPVFVADTRTLARIERALARDPLLPPPASGRRFFLEVVGRPRTWQEYLAGSHGMFAITPILPPGDRPGGGALGGGSGIDLLGVFRGVSRALREREARQIRERIDRELRIIEVQADSER